MSDLASRSPQRQNRSRPRARPSYPVPPVARRRPPIAWARPGLSSPLDLPKEDFAPAFHDEVFNREGVVTGRKFYPHSRITAGAREVAGIGFAGSIFSIRRAMTI